ncbi:MAG: hypothetical protein GY854_09640 [Deltaproteobacteria bacterium]|nr:hypothetical protein [Deltaproteobacteria bacterium]
MSARSLFGILAAVTLLAASSNTVRAQSPEEWRATEEGKTEKPALTAQQFYNGVTPGSGNNLPRVEELRGKAGTWVTWPGFMMRIGGGSRIFIQTTVALDYSLQEKKKKLVLKLNDAQVFLSNNRNPLVTTHFNTPVKRAYIKKRRKKTELVVELKVESAPQITQMVDQDGYHYLFIDFPQGTYPKATGSARPSYSGYGRPSETIEPETKSGKTNP